MLTAVFLVKNFCDKNGLRLFKTRYEDSANVNSVFLGFKRPNKDTVSA
jgi:hypothetical protein